MILTSQCAPEEVVAGSRIRARRYVATLIDEERLFIQPSFMSVPGASHSISHAERASYPMQIGQRCFLPAMRQGGAKAKGLPFAPPLPATRISSSGASDS